MNARGFERLEETAGQAHRDAVAVPQATPLAGPEGDQARRGQGLAVQVFQQNGGGLVFLHELARIDMTVAGAVLQRYTPLPPRAVGGRSRDRQQDLIRFARHRDGPVAGEPVAPVLITSVERLFDQQPPSPRTVDEQVTGNSFSGSQHHGLDEPVWFAQHGVDYLSFGADGPARLAVLPEESRIKAGIEMKGVGDIREG